MTTHDLGLQLLHANIYCDGTLCWLWKKPHTSDIKLSKDEYDSMPTVWPCKMCKDKDILFISAEHKDDMTDKLTREGEKLKIPHD